MDYNEFVVYIFCMLSVSPQIVHRALWERLKKFLNEGETLESVNAKLNKHTKFFFFESHIASVYQ